MIDQLQDSPGAEWAQGPERPHWVQLGTLGTLTGAGAGQGGGDRAGAGGMRSRQGPGPDSTLESSRESLRNSLVCLFVVTVLHGWDQTGGSHGHALARQPSSQGLL